MIIESNLWERMVKWFTISRVIITLWNLVAFCYHFFYIGIGTWTSIIIQLTAMITEYIVSGPYERILLWSNAKINEKTMFIMSLPRKILANLMSKILAFSLIFALMYNVMYYLRLEFFYLIDWGIDIDQLNQSMINVAWFTLIAGPIMGMIVIARKKRRRQTLLTKRHQQRIRFGPSV